MSKIDIGTLVKSYVDLRNELDERRKEYQELEAKIKSELDGIALEVMSIANDLGVDNFKTPFGTAYRNTKTSYKVLDWEEFMDWAIENDATHAVQKRVTKSAIDEIVDEKGEIPPGLDLFTEITFNFRAA